MPLPNSTRDEVLGYAKAHIPDAKWHVDFFDFVGNQALRRRLGKEYWAARCVYKMLEGVRATGSLRRTQVKLQVLLYASIYEAVLHYVLFTKYKTAPQVRKLGENTRRVKVSVSRDLRAKLVAQTRIVDTELVVTRETPGVADITKIRFDVKAETAHALGLVTAGLRDDLIEVFSARNAIHLHAEIRKGLKYELELSKKAYRRLMPFRQQVRDQLTRDGKL